MNVFDDYTRALLSAFHQHKVLFLVVDGYAVNYYGYRRTTGDIDLWIKPDNANKANVIKALDELSIDKDVLSELENMDFTQHLAFHDGEPPFRIDFMTYISGIDFEEAYLQKKDAVIDDLPVPFIHLNHLVLSKLNTGRLKDADDIEQLQKISRLKNKS